MFTVTVARSTVKFAGIKSISTFTGRPISVTATATDNDGFALTYGASGLPTGITMTPTGISGTAPLGSYQITVTATATDGGTAGVTFGLTVAVSTVKLAALPTQAVSLGQPVQVQAAGTDNGGFGVTWSATGLPTGVTISSNGLVTGTPTALGTSRATVTARATDGGTASTTLTITVKAAISTGVRPHGSGRLHDWPSMV